MMSCRSLLLNFISSTVAILAQGTIIGWSAYACLFEFLCSKDLTYLAIFEFFAKIVSSGRSATTPVTPRPPPLRTIYVGTCGMEKVEVSWSSWIQLLRAVVLLLLVEANPAKQLLLLILLHGFPCAKFGYDGFSCSRSLVCNMCAGPAAVKPA